MSASPWQDARTYYQTRWGLPVGRIGVDGGFSCPNRGGSRSGPGCSFCAEAANRPPYQLGAADLESQIDQGRAFQQSRYGFQKFSLYFQAYSSTWAPVKDLRSLYDRGLARAPFVELAVGTRPDCVPDEVADLLAGYQTPAREVWVELGLQSCRDETLVRIGRGHDVESYRKAAGRLRERGLKFTTHVMYGLPGETTADFLATLRLALDEKTSGLKFHDLLLVPGTRLHSQWQRGEVSPVEPEAYFKALVEALVLVPPHVVVWRVCSDPEDRRGPVSPGEKWPKNQLLNRLRVAVASASSARLTSSPEAKTAF